MVPDRAGADTHVAVHIPFPELRQRPGAPEAEEVWLRGAAGEPGYLTGKDAEAAACDAVAEPVVTGHADMRVVDKIIALALAAAGITLDGADPDPATTPATDGPARTTATTTAGTAATAATVSRRVGYRRQRSRGAHGPGRVPRPAAGPAQRFTPDAPQALRYAIARLAIDFVSGPAGLAGWLRTTLLAPPYNTPSLPLDIGYSDSIPASIRRAVLLRDRGCAWPRCGRPAAWCDVHHLQHKKDGGKTAVSECVLLCQFHHDVCIHRRGWRLILHPDGTTTAYGPDGQVLHSHSPPTARAG